MAQQLADLVRDAKAAVECVDGASAARMHQANSAVFIDVREDHEVGSGMIAGATHVPRSWLEWKLARGEDGSHEVFNQPGPFVFYCGGGGRSLFAAERARQMGLAEVFSLEGGYRGWCASGYPTA